MRRIFLSLAVTAAFAACGSPTQSVADGGAGATSGGNSGTTTGGGQSTSGGSSSGGGGSSGGTTGASTSGGSSGSTSGGTTAGGTTSGGGSGGSTGGSIPCPNPGDDGGVTIAVQVGLHPAAESFYSTYGLTAPSMAGEALVLASLDADGGYGILASTTLSGPGTYTFPNVPMNQVGIGILAILSDTSDGGVPMPACPSAPGSGLVGATDWYVYAASAISVGAPSQDLCNAFVEAIPASFVSALDCASGIDPSTANDLYAQGFELAYASSAPDGGGVPVSGISFSSSTFGVNFSYPTAGFSSAGSATSALGIGVASTDPPLAFVSAYQGSGRQFGQTQESGTEPHAGFEIFFSGP